MLSVYSLLINIDDSSLHDKSVDNDKSILESITYENIIKSKVKQKAGKRQSVTKMLNKIEDSFEQLTELDLTLYGPNSFFVVFRDIT